MANLIRTSRLPMTIRHSIVSRSARKYIHVAALQQSRTTYANPVTGLRSRCVYRTYRGELRKTYATL
jgi:hypothetical protein